MAETTPPVGSTSQQGRRLLVAVVTGELGVRIQAWREKHDPYQARRLPPHATLCYWAMVEDEDLLEKQVRHAFERPVIVRLGGVREFNNADHTFYVEVQDTAALDVARHRLYDGQYVILPRPAHWTWHVTCVRDSRGRDLDELRRAAAELRLDAPWRVTKIAHLELHDDRYEPLAEWLVGGQ